MCHSFFVFLFCGLTELLTSFATNNDKTCHESWQNPTAGRPYADPWLISGATWVEFTVFSGISVLKSS